ncbi:MAG TPA: glycosyltransferase [Flexivirga sp.]|uniref:glycosyltransferase n=1 Tax=Flexivirga sp. TaxID=1962927 RepID=UPI002BC572D2|nr:glycosyltransferase [Flexivirga sp.]HWC23439.1 glycosyltransferase [Flexivirga sp.]
MRSLRISHSAVVRSWRQREQSIRESGVDVRLLAARRWNEAGRALDLSPLPGEPVIPVRTFGTHPALFLYDPLPLWRALRSEMDVLDIHEEPFALATAQILLLRKLARQRAPYTLYSAQNLQKRYPPPFRWLERLALRHAAGLQVCNDAAGRICSGKGFPGRPVTIGLGVEHAVFHPGATITEASPSVTVGFAGRLERRKGVFVLLDAVAAAPELTLYVAGAGPAEDELRAAITERGLRERVQLLGALGSDDLAAFYRRIDVLAVPSLTTASWVEQFGRVAVEAMACGTPVVSSDSGALPEVVGDAGLVVPEGDVAALSSALREAAGPGRATLRAAGLQRAVRYDWRAIGAQFTELYRTVTHTPLPTPRPIHIIVVAYGAPDDLARCLAPLRPDRVLVVDNSSRADVAAVCAAAGVRYLDAGHNGGFGAGVNIGLAQRPGPGSDVLLLNPDAVITDADIDRLQHHLLAAPDLASVGPAQVDGTCRPARVGWPLPSPARVWREALGLDRLHPPPDEYVIGSVLLLRAEALAQVGGFDERFFLYAEETDWAKRAAMLGWRHTVVPEVAAVHLGGATSTDTTVRDAHFHAAQETFHRKHFGAAGWAVARAANVSGAALRSVILRDDRGADARARMIRYLRGPSTVRDQHLRATRSPERIE